MKKIIKIKTDKLFTILTDKVAKFAKEWGESGILHHADIRFWLDNYLPKDKPENRRYLHDIISLRNDVPQDERINGYSHMRTLFFNTSETIPIDNGELMLGKWQDIHFIELDSGDQVYPLQERTIICTFIKE